MIGKLIAAVCVCELFTVDSPERPRTRMMTQTTQSIYFLWHLVTSMNAFSGNVTRCIMMQCVVNLLP